MDPYLAVQVDEGRLICTEAIEVFERKVAAPVLAEHADAVRRIQKRVVEDVIEIAGRLIECKALLDHHGMWLPWLEQEFGWSDDTALNFMRVHEMAKSRNIRDLSMLPASGLYLLAKPSTPEAVRDDVLGRAHRGEPLSVKQIKGLIDQVCGKPAKPTQTEQLRDVAARMLHAMPEDPLVAELHRLLFNGEIK